MTPVQTDYEMPNPNAAKAQPLRPHYVGEVREGGVLRALELRVKIEGRDHTIALDADALTSFGLTGPAAVEQLRGIREAVERIAAALESSQETG